MVIESVVKVVAVMLGMVVRLVRKVVAVFMEVVNDDWLANWFFWKFPDFFVNAPTILNFTYVAYCFYILISVCLWLCTSGEMDNLVGNG